MVVPQSINYQNNHLKTIIQNQLNLQLFKEKYSTPLNGVKIQLKKGVQL
jgi:hypothetical protein